MKFNKYYGFFFWLSLVSLVVPATVAFRAFQERGYTKPTPDPDVSGVDHRIWDYLLKRYVEGGRIDYEGMGRDHLFFEYIREIGAARPERLKTENERLALACNAYNALVVKGVINHKITDSVDNFAIDSTGFFDLQEHVFAGQTISLNDLEHGLIRPTYSEPRIHVALVCAARSCPSIRPEAYMGNRVLQQLEDQSLLFANNPAYVSFNSETNELTLSSILNWYGDDWNSRFPENGYLDWLAQLVKDEGLRAGIRLACEGKAKIVFAEYDWALNSQREPGQSSGGKKSGGDFGSGSLPSH